VPFEAVPSQHTSGGLGVGALNSRQQHLGDFVAVARESAQLTNTYGFTGLSGSRRNPHVSTTT
jgi:hypothetical protein